MPGVEHIGYGRRSQSGIDEGCPNNPGRHGVAGRLMHAGSLPELELERDERVRAYLGRLAGAATV